MPNMRYIEDGGFDELIFGRIYDVVREYEEDDDNFVDVVGENGRCMHGIYASRFEPIEKTNNVPVDPVGIWAHHK